MSSKYLKQIESSIIVLFVFSLPFYNNSSILDKITPLLIIVWALITVIRCYISKSYFYFNIFFFILTGFYLLHVIGLLYTENLGSGLLKLENKLSFLIIPILASLSATLYAKQKWYLIAFVLANFIASIICLIIAFYDFKMGNLFYTSFSYFLHPSYFALYVVFSIHILWQFITTEKEMGVVQKWMLYITMLYFSIIVYFISSKIGIISGILSLSLVLFHEFRTTHKILGRIVFLLLLISIFIYAGLTNYRFKIFSENIRKPSTENTHTRLLIWQESINVIGEDFLFGQGTGDAQTALNVRYISKGYIDAYEHQLNAHNQYLETSISLGLMGFTALLLLLFFPFIYLRNNIGILPVVFLFLMCFNLLFESMLERFWGIIFFSFFYALFFISKEAMNDKSSRQV